MDASSINKEYINLIKKNDYKDDYLNIKDKVKHSNAKYKGKPVPFLYHPMFFTEKDMNIFQGITQTLMSISNKVIKHYIEDENYRKKFRYPKLLEELILSDHGYKINIPIGRFDIFYDGVNFKFCELNTDGSSAMNEDNTIARFLLESQPLKELKNKYEITYFDTITPWVDESIKLYHEFSNSNKKPVVAIVDFIENATIAEFYEFQKAYEKKGYHALICDIRDLNYQNKKLMHDGQEIDLIYRRAVTKEIIDRHDQIKDFIMAYKDKAVCVVGPMKSQIMHNKIIFTVLHDEETLSFLNEDEKQFVKNHIPITKRLNTLADKEEIINNKDRYVLKPSDLYASLGVYVGLDCSLEEWKDLVETYYQNDYLYQEFIKPYTRDFVQFEDELTVSPFKFILGLFVYNEKLMGFYTRIGKENIISGARQYFTVPNLLVKDKSKEE